MQGPPLTRDGRYLVIEGSQGPRLWRASNPHLSSEKRAELVARLMDARRAVYLRKGNSAAVAAARAEVEAAKVALGERGPVWWRDGQPDLNRTLVKNSPYRDWWEGK